MIINEFYGRKPSLIEQAFECVEIFPSAEKRWRRQQAKDLYLYADLVFLPDTRIVTAAFKINFFSLYNFLFSLAEKGAFIEARKMPGREYMVKTARMAKDGSFVYEEVLLLELTLRILENPDDLTSLLMHL